MIDILGFTRGTKHGEMDGPQYYRTYLPLREINRRDNGIETRIVGDKDLVGATDEMLGGRDIYMMSRMYQEDCNGFVDTIHAGGGVLVLDSDDDLTEDHKLVSGRGREFKHVLGQVDYVTVSTQPLADSFGRFTKNEPVVLQNHVDVRWMQKVAAKAKRLHTGFGIGVSGSPTHWGDWRVLAVPFARIARELDVVPILSGETPRYMQYVSGDRIELGGVPFAIYPVVLSQFDAVLCAVDSNDRFNDGKSNVKALECMSIGVVPICSRFAPYLELYDAGAPVVIVQEDSQDGWYEAMRKVVEDEEYVRTLKDRGPDWVRENKDMTTTGYRGWEKFYNEIAN